MKRAGKKVAAARVPGKIKYFYPLTLDRIEELIYANRRECRTPEEISDIEFVLDFLHQATAAAENVGVADKHFARETWFMAAIARALVDQHGHQPKRAVREAIESVIGANGATGRGVNSRSDAIEAKVGAVEKAFQKLASDRPPGYISRYHVEKAISSIIARNK